MYMGLQMKYCTHNAFTLVELLVVISIIAMLLAILMPSLTRVRGQAQNVVCLTKLRQMGIAAAAYTQSYNGYYPISYYTVYLDNGAINYSWDFTIRNDGGVSQRLPGLLWQGQTIEKIQQCPVFKGASNDGGVPYTGYNYNTSYIGHGEMEDVLVPVKAAAVKRSGSCALFGDGQWVGGANKYMRAPLGKFAPDNSFGDRASGAQGFRHLGKTNIAWADGHSSSQANYYTTTLPTSEGGIIEKYNSTTKTQKIGFLSPDNSAYDLE